MAGGASIAVVWTGRPCYSVTLLKTLKHTLLHCVTLWHSPNQCNTLPLLHCVVLHCVLREVGRTQSVISCAHRGSSLSPVSNEWNLLLRMEKVQTCVNWSKSPVALLLDDSVAERETRIHGWERRNRRKGETREKEKQEETGLLLLPAPYFSLPSSSISSSGYHSEPPSATSLCQLSVFFLPPFLLFLLGPLHFTISLCSCFVSPLPSAFVISIPLPENVSHSRQE